MRQGARQTLILLAVLGIALLAGGIAGSERAASAEWTDELLDSIESAAAEYNEDADAEVGFLERWILGNERINLHVRDAEGASAVYSLRVDQQRRVTDVDRGRFENPTVRVRTTKRVIEQISASDDTETAVRQEIRSGRIRLERVLYLFPGVAIFVGGRDVMIGGGVAVASLALTKFVGINPVLSVLATIKEKLLVALRSLWEGLSGIATLLTILEKLDMLDQVQQQITQLWTAFSERVHDILDRLLPQDETDREQGQ